MKLPLHSVAVVSLLTLVFCSTACQSTKSTASATPAAAHAMSEAEMMAHWTAYATPGAGHKALATKVGKWNLIVKMYATPGAPANESGGTSEVRWILGERYLDDTTEGVFMGQPFQGHGLTGYDNLTKKYNSTWVDTMGTGIVKAEGTYDEASRTFTYAGVQPDFAAGKYVPTRTVETLADHDHWSMRTYGPDAEGREFLSMEILYTRAKP